MAAEWSIEVKGPIVEELEDLLEQGDDDEAELGTFVIKHMVDWIGGKGSLKVEVCSDEHPPPHFRVSYQGENANFAIATGVRLKDNRGLERYERKIRKWWKKNISELIRAWNDSRPSDCPVGPIRGVIG